MRAAFPSFFLVACGLVPLASAQPAQPEVPRYRTETNLLYRAGTEVTGSVRDRCRLDVYCPDGVRDFPTVVWFHGGGLTAKP
jgi:acetyl esterase/lipase